jgi:hypothetical protein
MPPQTSDPIIDVHGHWFPPARRSVLDRPGGGGGARGAAVAHQRRARPRAELLDGLSEDPRTRALIAGGNARRLLALGESYRPPVVARCMRWVAPGCWGSPLPPSMAAPMSTGER